MPAGLRCSRRVLPAERASGRRRAAWATPRAASCRWAVEHARQQGQSDHPSWPEGHGQDRPAVGDRRQSSRGRLRGRVAHRVGRGDARPHRREGPGRRGALRQIARFEGGRREPRRLWLHGWAAVQQRGPGVEERPVQAGQTVQEADGDGTRRPDRRRRYPGEPARDSSAGHHVPGDGGRGSRRRPHDGGSPGGGLGNAQRPCPDVSQPSPEGRARTARACRRRGLLHRVVRPARTPCFERGLPAGGGADAGVALSSPADRPQRDRLRRERRCR